MPVILARGRNLVGMSESDTRDKPIDLAIHARWWSEYLIRQGEAAGFVKIVDGQLGSASLGWVNNSALMAFGKAVDVLLEIKLRVFAA